MNGNLAHLGEDLCPHLFRLQATLNNINGLFGRGPIVKEAEIASRLEDLQVAMQQSSERAARLRETLQAGLDRDAALAPETLSRLIDRRLTAPLHARADLIEHLAIVAVELATLSAVEAERVTMEAILARRQAVAVQVQRDHQL